MSELLDTYDENGNFVGTEERSVVHQKGLWHKTIHCWIVKDKTKIVFQRRSFNLNDNPGKFYTTASGHIRAGESLEVAFRREITEELGLNISEFKPLKVAEVIYKTDFITKNNTEFHDRVFCNIFAVFCDVPLTSYHPQLEELDGVIEVDMVQVLALFKGEVKSVSAVSYVLKEGKLSLQTEEFGIDDFLCNPNETHYEKYGFIIEKILQLSV